jgi:hypothetical protein
VWKQRRLPARTLVVPDEEGVPLAPKPKLLLDRPVYGRPLTPPGLAHEPVNEMGVVYLFGLLGHRMDYVVTRIQSEFPDCEAFREVARDGGRGCGLNLSLRAAIFCCRNTIPKNAT